MTMRTLLILAAIVSLSAPAFAQTAAPKVGGKRLKQVKPLPCSALAWRTNCPPLGAVAAW